MKRKCIVTYQATVTVEVDPNDDAVNNNVRAAKAAANTIYQAWFETSRGSQPVQPDDRVAILSIEQAQ